MILIIYHIQQPNQIISYAVVVSAKNDSCQLKLVKSFVLIFLFIYTNHH